jgi:hypothetical protein
MYYRQVLKTTKFFFIQNRNYTVSFYVTRGYERKYNEGVLGKFVHI